MTSALIVIDLQAGTTSAALAHPIEDVIANASRLAKAFREAGRPVVVATVTGTPAGRTTYSPGAQHFPGEFTAVDARFSREPGDLAIERAAWGVFGRTTLNDQLSALGVTDVVITGLATSFGVESTARQGYDLGYGVVIVSDAVSDRSIESHDHSISRVFPALGRVLSTEELLAELV
jgi:nicotinamidase-related amidase